MFAVLALVAASVVPSGAAAQGGDRVFDDVAEDAYYGEPVAALAASGVFVGTECEAGFCPTEPINRRTMAVWIVRVLDGVDPPARSESRFGDVDAAGIHAPLIERMAELGVTQGCGDGTNFCPDRSVTRSQMAVFLSRAYDLPAGPDPGFSDVPSDAWYAPDVARLAASGITTGCGDGTVFCPGRETTRAQMATFLYRALRWQEQAGTSAEGPGDDEPEDGSGDITVVAGGSFTCVLQGDTIDCWGSRNYDRGQTDAPAGTFKAVAAGGNHSCGLRSDNTVVCWGDNRDGRTDAPAGTFKAVAAGGNHSCGLRSDNTVVCWGDNFHGQTDAPAGTFNALAAGNVHSCGLLSDNTITCWGYNGFGRADPPAGSFKAVAAGVRHGCGLRSDNTVVCWGDDEAGITDAPDGEFRAIAAGGAHTCGLRSNNIMACWGDNRGGQTETSRFNARLHPDIFFTEENEFSRFVKHEMVDNFSDDHPWLMETWIYTNRPDFEYVVQRVEGGQWDAIVSFSGGTAVQLTIQSMPVSGSHDTLVHEFAHIYTLSVGVAARPGPLAIAHLYFDAIAKHYFGEQRGSGFCSGDELYADAAVPLVLQDNPPISAYWSLCGFGLWVPPEAVSVVESAFAGEMPQWFYDTFQAADGSIDYEAIWTAIRLMPSSSRGVVVSQLEDEFGGYCSKSARYSIFDDNSDLAQPWRDGGCPEP